MLNKLQFALKQKTIIFGGIIVLWGINGCSGSRPEKSDSKHRIQPLSYAGPLEAAKERLNQVIKSHGNAWIISQNRNYWHVEFTSRWMSFVDDVEFYFTESEELIHVRSSSRLGYYDFGVNRKRVEKIRFQFEELAK